ncbi:hypothetical protein EYC80_001207 [Monilinia laxa]|uniref:glutathione-specific gamma-glutamylcyclotransferase n=1 Tax=Monilinia laxa TaxID=61186 RepID=A0A5N6K8H1_MONLA|nr:hypothetical protein EYC80_001207 [Monilinia laxa]
MGNRVPNPRPQSRRRTPDNAQFTGPQDPQELAEHIWRSEGPSGLNRDYLWSLDIALDELSPESGDEHVKDLADRVRKIADNQWGVEAEASHTMAIDHEFKKSHSFIPLLGIIVIDHLERPAKDAVFIERDLDQSDLGSKIQADLKNIREMLKEKVIEQGQNRYQKPRGQSQIVIKRDNILKFTTQSTFAENSRLTFLALKIERYGRRKYRPLDEQFIGFPIDQRFHHLVHGRILHHRSIHHHHQSNLSKISIIVRREEGMPLMRLTTTASIVAAFIISIVSKCYSRIHDRLVERDRLPPPPE